MDEPARIQMLQNRLISIESSVTMKNLMSHLMLMGTEGLERGNLYLFLNCVCGLPFSW